MRPYRELCGVKANRWAYLETPAVAGVIDPSSGMSFPTEHSITVGLTHFFWSLSWVGRSLIQREKPTLWYPWLWDANLSNQKNTV